MEAVRPFVMLMEALVCDALFGARKRVLTRDMMESVVTQCKLIDKGKIFICGGMTPLGTTVPGYLIEMGRIKWDISEVWHFDIVHHKSTTLRTGSVLVTGGVNIAKHQVPEGSRHCCFVAFHEKQYDEEVIYQLGLLNQGRYHHAAVTLQDGQAMVTGGLSDEITSAVTTVEFLDPDSLEWTVGACPLPMHLWGHAMVVLSNGLVLICGGQRDEALVTKCWLYNPGTDTFSETGSMLCPRMRHGCVLLPDGRVMISGGRTAMTRAQQYSYDVLNLCEFYDPDTGTWSPAPSMLIAHFDHVCICIPERVIVMSTGHHPAEHFVLATQKWSRLSGVPSVSLGACGAHFF